MQILKILYLANDANLSKYPNFPDWPQSWQIKRESFANLPSVQAIGFDALVAYVDNPETVEPLIQLIKQRSIPPCYVIIESAPPNRVSQWIKAGIEYVFNPESARDLMPDMITETQKTQSSGRNPQNPNQQLQSLNRIASMFAKMIGFALENIRTYENLEKLIKERTESLTQANERLGEKAKELSNAAFELANANIQMLAVQEELEEKNKTAKRLLEERSKSKQELQATLDASTSVIMMVNEKERITATNRNLHKFFGLYKKDVIHKPFLHFTDLIAPLFEDRNAFETMVQNLITHADEPELQDPTLEVFRARALKLLYPKEKYVAIFSTQVRGKSASDSRVWTIIDITKLKVADEQLHAIVRVSPIPYIITRMSDGTILYVNEPLASLIGVNAEEIIGRGTPDFIAEPGKREYILDQVKKYGALQNYELEIKRYDGSTIWMIASLVQTEIDNEKVLIGALYNINERRRAEEALRRERNFVSGILDTSGALILVLDPEGRIVRFNRACETLTGFALETIRGKKVWDLFILPHERKRVKENLTELHENQPSTQTEYTWVTADKDERLITWSNTALFDDQGDVEFIISTGIDITDRIGAEKKLAERLRYEEGLALCVQELLTVQEMHTALSAALNHLQVASQAARAYIFENKINKDGDLYLYQVVHSQDSPLSLLPNSVKKCCPAGKRSCRQTTPLPAPQKIFPNKNGLSWKRSISVHFFYCQFSSIAVGMDSLALTKIMQNVSGTIRISVYLTPLPK